MAIAVLTSNESGADSLIDINANFADLDTTKADLASPTFTGAPVLPTGTIAVTQTAGDNTTAVATTAFVLAAIAAGSTTTFPQTQVFSGTSPTSYTDLDLSSVVGATQKMVMLRLRCTSNTGPFYFRRNGETIAQTAPSNGGGVSVGSIDGNNGFVCMIVATDASGVVEWMSNGAYSGTTISVESYW